MKIVITEEQFNNLYSAPDRPSLTEVEYVVEMIQEGEEDKPDDVFDLGADGEVEHHHLYYFYIGEAFFDEFYNETYLELFDEYKENPEDCSPFVDAVISSIIEKMKQSIEEKKAAKILKRVIKNESVVRFKESDIVKIIDAHFGNFICSEFLEEAR